MDRSGEKVLDVEEITVAFLQKSLIEGINSDMLKERGVVLNLESPVQIFMGDPSMGIELTLTSIAGSKLKGEPDALTLIVEPL